MRKLIQPALVLVALAALVVGVGLVGGLGAALIVGGLCGLLVLFAESRGGI